ncbi:MAG TPA: protein phosphatase 2C domain-containing protein [Gemmatimonadaceae bacterium]|nr:protein phosphatase 2C domain-containing protein [Gemmatimonadaceae bacterium]
MTLEVSGKTHLGRVRTSNEDRYFIGVLHKAMEIVDSNLEVTDAITSFSQLDAYMLMVADGVGGVAGGERASQSAVFSLTTYLARTAACTYDPDVEQEDEFLQRLEEALQRAHDVVRSIGTGSRAPATTLTMALVLGARAYIAHVGDSRAYIYRGGRLRQITRDQTMSAYLQDLGVSHDPRGENKLGNMLASAVGGSTMVPTIGLVDVAPGDSLLLCSDGLTKHVPDDRIAERLQSGKSASGVCDELVNAALAAGGTDNVTVIVARVSQ